MRRWPWPLAAPRQRSGSAPWRAATSARWTGPAKLDRQTYRLVQIAALVALDGPLVSWVAQLDAADEAELDLEQVLGALAAVAPIVGTPRAVSAGAKIARATGLTEAGHEA